MEQLWSREVATHRTPPQTPSDGKEEVNGSNPLEGFIKAAA
jgi:hypothetical protein